MSQDTDGLPTRPFFNCSPEGLFIVDGAQAKNLLSAESMEPWIIFENGESNIIDSTPQKVASREGQQIAVECEGGTVHIDFEEGRARKVTPDGEYVYSGTLDERNDGMGYISVS